MMEYGDDDMLMLSGIQHFMFCPRQWALIHLEKQWDENRFTVEGDILHKHVDDPLYRHVNNGIVTLRSIPVASKTLGLYGYTDAVELHPSDKGILINGISYKVVLYPVEYKRGEPKNGEADIVQLVAQCICLEEMYSTHIPEAALFYNKIKRRTIVSINDDLRKLTRHLSSKMHKLYSEGKTPKAESRNSCRKCSLVNICLPELGKKNKVTTYLKIKLYEEDA